MPDGAELLDQTVAFIRRFVVLSSAQADVMALCILHSHAVAAADTTPYLHLTSVEKQSGKTRALEVCQLLVFRPWYTGRTTAAALVRKVDAEHPTLLLDETDAAFRATEEYVQALRGTLNLGHRRGGKVTVCVGQGGEIATQNFDVFGPKAIAGIGKLPDTVADRSIPIELQRKSSAEKVERFRRRVVEPEVDQLREQLHKWAETNIRSLRELWPELPEQLTVRQQDCVEPLFAIADIAGGNWPRRARVALLELLTGTAAEDDSVGVRLLADVQAVFMAKRVDKLPSAELIDALAQFEGARWAEFQHGGKITPNRLAQLLSPYQIYPRDIRLAGDRTPKGYLRDDFQDAWSRYLHPRQAGFSAGSVNETPHSPQSSTDAGKAQFSTPPHESLVALTENDKTPAKMPIVAAVAEQCLTEAPRQSALAGEQSEERQVTDQVGIEGCHCIYAPKGQAGEYAPLATNPYRGCGHGCSYCYVPGVIKMGRPEFDAGAVPRPGYLANLIKDAQIYQRAGITEQVMLSFTTDPYHPGDTTLTRRAIEILQAHGFGICTLTKSGTRALRDLDLFRPDRDAFASTVTSLDSDFSRRWELNAALPGNRLAALRRFHDAGIFTWVSLEPMLDVESSMEIVRETHSFVNLYKIGRTNYLPITNTTDWRGYTERMIELCARLGVRHYIKRDLQAFLPPGYNNPMRVEQCYAAGSAVQEAPPYSAVQAEALAGDHPAA